MGIGTGIALRNEKASRQVKVSDVVCLDVWNVTQCLAGGQARAWSMASSQYLSCAQQSPGSVAAQYVFLSLPRT